MRSRLPCARIQDERAPGARRVGRRPSVMSSQSTGGALRTGRQMKIAVAFDHRGVALREAVLEALEGHEVIDLGTAHDATSASTTRTRRARSARRSRAARPSAAILVCGSGAGAAIAACKMAGIRAAICHDLYSAHQAVEHDDMNVLCLGSEIVGASVARELVGGLPRGAVRRRRALRRAAREGCSDGKGDEAMAKSRLAAARRARAVGLDRPPLARVRPLGRAAADGRRGRRHRAHVEPVDLPEGDRGRRRLRRADQGAASTTTDDPREIFFALAIDDVRDACDVLRPVWERDGRAGRLRLARGRPGARRRHRRARSSRRSSCTTRSSGRTSTSRSRRRARACRRSRTAIARGVSINITLIFSLERYARRRRGLPARASSGSSPTAAIRRRSPRSRRSSSRAIDTETDRRLEELGNTELQGKLGIANAKLAYTALPGGVRGAALGAPRRRRARRSSGRSGPRPRPRTRPTATCMYVEELIGPDTVNTMPPETRRGVPGSRRGARRHGARRRRRGRARCSTSCARPASTTTTSSRRSRSRACRSSPTRSTS